MYINIQDMYIKMGKTLFMEALGTSPEIRILDLLITGRDTDYSISDISRSAEVSWGTIHKVLPKLVKSNLIRQTRTIGRAKLFQINNKNFIANALIELYDNILRDSVKLVKETLPVRDAN